MTTPLTNTATSPWLAALAALSDTLSLSGEQVREVMFQTAEVYRDTNPPSVTDAVSHLKNIISGLGKSGDVLNAEFIAERTASAFDVQHMFGTSAEHFAGNVSSMNDLKEAYNAANGASTSNGMQNAHTTLGMIKQVGGSILGTTLLFNGFSGAVRARKQDAETGQIKRDWGNTAYQTGKATIGLAVLWAALADKPMAQLGNLMRGR